MTRWLRSILRFLESARLATWLLVFLGVWAILGTVIPQGDAGVPAVAAWNASWGVLASVVTVVGLHQAFGAPVFDAAAVLLGISTALCAWRRTRAAASKARSLRDAASIDAGSLSDHYTLAVRVSGGQSDADVLDAAAAALADLGVATRRRGGVISAVSSPWSVWGSPVFHWGLLAIMLAILIGVLTRSEGLMGVPVGRALADQPDNYGVYQAGPIRLARAQRSIRVDDFKKSYVAGGIDRGPTPIVSVLGADGDVLKTAAVYPNHPLQIGSTTIHPSAWGFAVAASLVDAEGAVIGEAVRLVDTSEETSDGTVPVGELTFTDASRQPAGTIVLTVPLQRGPQGLVVPEQLSAHVVASGKDGSRLADGVLSAGETLALPTGSALRIDGVTYYARLTVVDDITIPLLYGAMALAMLGLVMTLVMRQQAIVFAVTGPEGGERVVYGSIRLWRNAPTTKEEIRQRLEIAVGMPDEEDGS